MKHTGPLSGVRVVDLTAMVMGPYCTQIMAAPVRMLDELFDNPHLNDAGFFETVDTPNGPVRFPGPPAWFSRTPGRVAGPAPRLGAHTAEIMAELEAPAGLTEITDS